MSAPVVVSVDSIDVYYDKSQILFGVALELKQGQTLALLGRNGAGKSTTMKAIAGLAPPRKGSIKVFGKDMTGKPAHLIARAGLGYVPEDRQVFPEHSVEDNLLIAEKRGVNGENEWPLERIFKVFPLLLPLRNRMAGRLSGGEQQMLAIARTLMGNPIGDLLRELRSTGATILIAEQNMHFCLGIASDAVVIDKGQIVYRDTIGALKANDEVRRRYLAM
jgi:branched-chain amino acid transport system ATP-binding protein